MKSIILLFSILNNCPLISFAMAKESYFKVANTNRKNYQAVPQNELIFGKVQAVEPLYFYKGKLRGHGAIEPIYDQVILNLRKNKIDVYVDYFTNAKNHFYLRDENYEICSVHNYPFTSYQEAKISDSKIKFNNKFRVHSIPFFLLSIVSKFAIQPSKIPAIESYKYPGTNVYNLESIVNDPDLYSVAVKDSSSAFKHLIYNDGILVTSTDKIIKREYKKRFYEFVASDAFQLVLMLKGKRMHWVDLLLYDTYYINQLKISKQDMEVFEYSPKHPKDIKNSDYMVSVLQCRSTNKKKLDQIITITNRVIKEFRTNYDFWSKNLKSFAQITETSYTPPEEFYRTKINFKLKKQMDSGEFDLK